MFDSLTVVSPQGVGDCLWLWQILSPQTAELNFEIVEAVGESTPSSRRSEGLLKALPGVGTVGFVPYDFAKEGTKWLTERVAPEPLLRTARFASRKLTATHVPPKAVIRWAANGWLEQGVPLEQIDEALPPRWDLGVKGAPVRAGLSAGRYLVLYCSGDATRHQKIEGGVWSPLQWARLVDRVCFHHGVGTKVPVLLVGSPFDAPAQDAISVSLTRAGFTTHRAVNLTLPELVSVFQNCWGFLGYQSGLSAIAALCHAKQVIVYFNRLNRMTDTWAPPADRGTGRFNWAFFQDSPDAVAHRAKFGNPAGEGWDG